MITVSKITDVSYCSSCGDGAKYKISINDSRIIFPGSQVLCQPCMDVLGGYIAPLVTKKKKTRKPKPCHLFLDTRELN